jgi:hypothetical protein
LKDSSSFPNGLGHIMFQFDATVQSALTQLHISETQWKVPNRSLASYFSTNTEAEGSGGEGMGFWEETCFLKKKNVNKKKTPRGYCLYKYWCLHVSWTAATC